MAAIPGAQGGLRSPIRSFQLFANLQIIGAVDLFRLAPKPVAGGELKSRGVPPQDLLPAVA